MTNVPTELETLFESSKRLYQSKAEEAISRLSLIRNSSLLDKHIRLSIDPILERLIGYSNAIEKTENADFKGIHELKKKIKVEELILRLLENAISTFISNRRLSTTLPILFDDIYERFYKRENESSLPFLVVSREGEELQTYSNVKDRSGKLLMGIIGIPPHSLTHIHEWILAGHEFGHIIAHEKLDVGIEYDMSHTTDAIMKNYMMEISADITAMQIFGPVFLEALLNEFTGAERKPGETLTLSPTHPPILWRLLICYKMSTPFDRPINKAKEIRGVVKEVINKLYPKPEEYNDSFLKIKYGKLSADVQKKITPEKRGEIRPIDDLKECYGGAEEVKELLLKGIQCEIGSYSPDQIVIGGYLASRENPPQFKSYTQKAIEYLIRTK